MMSSLVEVYSSEGIYTVSLNRSDALNALDMAMFDALNEAVSAAFDDPHTRLVVLRAKGKHFSVGGDLSYFESAIGASPEKRAELLESLVVSAHRLTVQIASANVPVIAFVQGAASGYAMSLALACDLVFVQPGTRFLSAYSAIGASPDGGMSFFLPELLGVKKAAECLLLNRVIDAQQALDFGLVNDVIPDSDWEASILRISAELVAGSAYSQGSIKQLLWKDRLPALKKRLEHEQEQFVACGMQTHFDEGVTSFKHKTKPVFR